MNFGPSRTTAQITGDSLGIAHLSRAWQGAGVLLAMALASLVGAAGIIVSLHGG